MPKECFCDALATHLYIDTCEKPPLDSGKHLTYFRGFSEFSRFHHQCLLPYSVGCGSGFGVMEPQLVVCVRVLLAELGSVELFCLTPGEFDPVAEAAQPLTILALFPIYGKKWDWWGGGCRWRVQNIWWLGGDVAAGGDGSSVGPPTTICVIWIQSNSFISNTVVNIVVLRREQL